MNAVSSPTELVVDDHLAADQQQRELAAEADEVARRRVAA